MSFLNKLKSIITGGPQLDPSLGNPIARGLLGDVERADVSTTNELLLKLREGAWDDRDFYVDIVADHIPRQVLDLWCQSQPVSPIPFLLRGMQSIGWAWEARGRGASDTVSDEGQRQFEERLKMGQQDLLRTAQLDPADPTPYGHLITIARGLQEPPDTAVRWLNEAVSRFPEHFSAHKAMLMLLTEKWGGSHDSMFEFARSAAGGATQAGSLASDLWTLVIMGHIERWLYFSFEKDDAGAASYLADPDVRAEAVDAWDRSLASPHHRGRRTTIHCHNIAAFWFYLTKDRERLQRELVFMGAGCSEFPWLYFEGDAAITFEKARNMQFQAE